MRVIWLSTSIWSCNWIEHRSEYLGSAIMYQGMSGEYKIENLPTLKGSIASGEFYYVFSSLLYCEDSTGRSTCVYKGPIGGCHFQPLDLPLCRRRGAPLICAIAISPSELLKNLILHFSVPGIVGGTTEVFESFDTFCNKCTIFWNLCGLVGDHLTASEVRAVLKHMFRAPCTCCAFQLKNGTACPKCSSSTEIYSESKW